MDAGYNKIPAQVGWWRADLLSLGILRGAPVRPLSFSRTYTGVYGPELVSTG